MQSQTTKYRSVHCHLDSLWEQFEAGKKSAKQLLKACCGCHWTLDGTIDVLASPLLMYTLYTSVSLF